MKPEIITKQRLHNAMILVVDDVEINRAILVRSLNSRGYNNIVLANDGAEALQLTHDLNPDLVILDLVMPGMDGFSYCQAVRHDPRFDNMPILVQTMLEDMEDKIKAFYLGASDYVCKPIDPDELSARAQVHLTKKLLVEDIKTYHEQITAEMDAARTMQNRLMPDTQHNAMCERIFNMKIAAHFETSSKLGGDCWGMKPLSEKKLAIYAYDFSGHGISAAMNVFRMHTLMQECLHASGDPGQFLGQLNKRLYPLIDRSEFATMFYGIIETDANCLLYAAAAAPSPLLFSGGKQEGTLLSGQGFPLGAISNAHYETKYASFSPGDLLLLYSDCVIETMNHTGDTINERHIHERIETILQTHPANPASACVSGLQELLKAHQAAPINDDLTINAYWRALE